MGLGGAPDVRRLRHHGFVEGDAAGGVEQDDVVAAELAGLDGPLRDLHRRLAGHDRQRIDADLLAEHGELFHGGRAAGIEGGHQGLALHHLGEPLGDFRRGRGFARALQTDHHDGDRRRRIEVDRVGGRPQGLDQLVMDDLDHHLAGRDRLDHLDADGALFELVDEAAHHVEGDVGLQEGAADFARRRIHVGSRQGTPPRQAVENAGKPFGQAVEHQISLLSASS